MHIVYFHIFLIFVYTNIRFLYDYSILYLRSMKKLLIFILLTLPVVVKGQTTWFPASPPGSTSFSPSFRFIGAVTDSLAMKWYISNGGHFSQVYTAAQVNALIGGSHATPLYLNSDTSQNVNQVPNFVNGWTSAGNISVSTGRSSWGVTDGFAGFSVQENSIPGNSSGILMDTTHTLFGYHFTGDSYYGILANTTSLNALSPDGHGLMYQQHFNGHNVAFAPTDSSYITKDWAIKNVSSNGTLNYQYNFQLGSLPTGITLANPGSSVSYAGSTATLTGTPSNYVNYFAQNIITGNKTITLKAKILATGSQVFIGNDNALYNFKVVLNQTTGFLTTVLDNGSTVQTSATGMTIVSGDSLLITQQWSINKILTTVKNLSRTTPSVSDIFTFPINVNAGATTPTPNYVLPQIGNPVIGVYTGSLKLVSFTVVKPSATIMGIFDSIGAGYFSGGIDNMFATMLGITASSSPGSTSGNMLADLPEIIAAKPQYVVVELGANDVIQSVGTSVYVANMIKLIDTLKVHNIVPYILNIPPISGATAYNTALKTAYNDIVDINSPLSGTAGHYNPLYAVADSVHLTPQGNLIVAQTLSAAMAKTGYKNTLNKDRQISGVLKIDQAEYVPGTHIKFQDADDVTGLQVWQAINANGLGIFRSKTLDGVTPNFPYFGLTELDSVGRNNVLYNEGRYSPAGFSNIIYNKFFGDGYDFINAGDSVLVRILRNGNVGIGTTTPSSLLNVYGTNPVVTITQNPSIAGAGTLLITAAGTSSIADAATITMNGASSLWSTTANGNGLFIGSADKTSVYANIKSTGITAPAFVTTGGASSQVVLGDGTLGTYSAPLGFTAENVANKTATASSSTTTYPNWAGLTTALSVKQNTLTFDSTPTSASTNPVTSGGVFTALATKQASLSGTGNVYSTAGTITYRTQVFNEIPTGVFNGTNTAFTAAHTPVTGTVQVWYDGILQRPTTDYSVSGATITFTFIPTNTSGSGSIMIAYSY